VQAAMLTAESFVSLAISPGNYYLRYQTFRNNKGNFYRDVPSFTVRDFLQATEIFYVHLFAWEGKNHFIFASRKSNPQPTPQAI